MSKAAKRERQRENRERAREERERLMRRDRRMKTTRSLLYLVVPIMVILVVISLTSDNDDKKATAAADPLCKHPVTNPTRTFTAAPPDDLDTAQRYTATVCTSEGVITLDLDAKTAPVATNNFVFLARNGFYDGLTFHRASKNFVIQGGDPDGNGSGGPGYSVSGEVPTDHYPVGALAAAKTADPAGSFGSQFFIVTGKNGATLPNDYARFGEVTKGLAVAKKIESFAPTNGDGVPTKKVTITKITIEAGGKALTPTTTLATTTTTAAPTPSST